MKEQVKKYLDAADEKVVRMVSAMLQADAEGDGWDESGEDAKVSIEQGLKDAKAGRITPHSEVMNNYRKWLS